MILCDTNIFISAFNGKMESIDQLNKIGLSNVVLSAITIMELYQGMGNKKELAQMKKQIKFYDVIHIDTTISEQAIDLVEKYKLSHGLQIPDAIIGATAIACQIPLYTYNIRDFDFLPGLLLYSSL